MKYIWINPVAENMYHREALACFLKKHGFVQVRCNTDWGAVVKGKYKSQIEAGRGTVADMRCPMAGMMAADYRQRRGAGKQVDGERGAGQRGDSLVIPDIEPILIHCAREISGRRDLEDGLKIITTPCRALADAGNALKLKDTRFLTWNGLLRELGETVADAWAECAAYGKAAVPGGATRCLKSSPIPPGFFEDMETDTISLTGEETIRLYLEKESWKQVRLVEMLYCDMGCHNGDGVMADEE